ncbi:carboxymuconolactone decarboxylase [Cupriavidus gilardii]|uniref:CMD domain-containing protein n=1 Tax=Cupriavidus gilardii TaxID=82541 RepID=UPI001EE6338B|nr:peroxidase-related enzyme [Cupriavidus gilardii]MCG5262071.1 peroxidase-related enzyme [Cupriavidus gilardii]MDF9430682.1 carboxymuconolactone decarboxylase [Cupriavidus gilardii]
MTASSTQANATAELDLIDRLAGLAAGSDTHALRHRRDKVAVATEGSYRALFDPALPGLTLTERLAVALYASRLTPSAELAAHYLDRLQQAGADAATVAALDGARLDGVADARLRAMLAFTQKLIEKPVEGDRAALLSLPAAGVSTPEVVTLAQLIAFLSYQARLVAGLRALSGASQGQALPSDQAPAAAATTRPGDTIRINGFTNEVLDWKAWLDVVPVDRATPEQIAVLEESHPKAKVSDYYLFLVHQPEILRQRSAAFNAIMYAPGGMARAERELASTVVSCVNGCVYCASVHAQRFEQLAKRNDAIAQVFDNPRTAGTSARERAIARFSVALTEHPDRVGAASLAALREAGLSDAEILDGIHAIAIFAWANRLMLNLGEPVVAVQA